jgi:16S rRNA processing protein RimM
VSVSQRRRNRVPESRQTQSTTRSSSQPGELIELGRIVNRHGIRGEVRVLPHNPDSDAVLELPDVVLIGADGAIERRAVLASRRHKQFVLLRLADVATANDAEALVGRCVAMPRDRLPPVGPAQVYHVDLIGCAVRTTAGEALGIVEELIVTGSNDVCVVRGAGREVLIPLVADVIAALDTSARTIVVHPLPGLLDP